MSSEIKGKVGWLKDENGEIFIPKTLTSAIQNAEGTNLDNLLKNLSPSPDGEGGNSQNSGGINYAETILYDGGYTKDTNIELSDDINNYDYIKIIFGWMDNGNLIGNGQPIYITPKELEHNNSSYKYGNICTLYSTQHIWYSITGSNYKLLFDGGSNVYLYQIIGIKFVSDSTGGSGVEIKSFTYTGKGGDMELDITGINFILGIYGNGFNNTNVCMLPLHVNSCGFITTFRYIGQSSGGYHSGYIEKVDNTLIFKGGADDSARCNIAGEEYTVYYI